jgi:hypothetical protein
MNPRSAAIAASIAVALNVIYNLTLYAAGLVTEPWFKCLPYVIGGSVFALISLPCGLYARLKGGEGLSRPLQTGALFGIMVGGCFILYYGMALMGIDIFTTKS